MKLEFNEENHEYFLDGVPISSVSEIIKPITQKIYGTIDEDILKTAAERGTKVHRAIEFLSKYDLKKVDIEISGYVEAYKKFRNEHKDWILKHSELRTYHKSFLYGMTVDEIYETPDGTVILDIKTTKIAHAKAWSIQLSGYKSGYESQHEKVAKITALQLFEDGHYVLHELEDNFSVFLSCLEIYKFLEAI